MNKLKKVAAVVIALVCSFAFATTAFAATADQIKKATDALVGYGMSASDAAAVVNNLNANGQLDGLIANKDAVKATADKAKADVASSPRKAGDILTSAANSLGINVVVNSFTVDRDDEKVYINATVAGVTTNVAPSIEHRSSGSDDKSTSNTTSAAPQNATVAAAVASSTTSPAVLTASSTAVIKATGDSSFAVVLAAVLAVAAVLGMAVRKNTQMNVA